MRLERHVGGLGRARAVNYLERRGWTLDDARWTGPHAAAEPVPLSRALHHQLTVDLCAGLHPYGWRITGYSQRGYAQLADPVDQDRCSLPLALRRQARRSQCAVRDFTYALFLKALDDPP